METIRLGNAGGNVSLAKENLERNGYQINQSASFDENMQSAVIDFQQKNGLVADGIIGYRTWEALLFSGRPASEKLTDEDFRLMSQLLGCETAALKAVHKIETEGRDGFFAPDKPTILFEGHIFWKQLKTRGIEPIKCYKGNEDILYPKQETGHYKEGIKEYERLEKARLIDREAADASASWGMFQIMGFNYKACDEKSVESFVAAMCESERKQLILFGRFIWKGGMLPALIAKNWSEFARRYNGPSYTQNKYDAKLAAAYYSYSR